MTITIESKVGDIMEQCPNHKDIFEKHWGQKVSSALLKLVKNLKIKYTTSRVGWSQEQIDAFLKDVNDAITKAQGEK